MKKISRAKAEAQELKWYFTGKPCKHGHVAKRYVSGWRCVECVKIESVVNRDMHVDACRKYYWKNPAKHRDIGKRNYWKNPEKFRERARINRWTNPDVGSAANKKWYAKRGRNQRIIKLAAYELVKDLGLLDQLVENVP